MWEGFQEYLRILARKEDSSLLDKRSYETSISKLFNILLFKKFKNKIIVFYFKAESKIEFTSYISTSSYIWEKTINLNFRTIWVTALLP